MRRLAIACLLVLFVSWAAMAQTDLPEYASVVRVTVTHADFKGWAYGSGFFVNPDTVLTASHVVAHAIGDKSAHILALWSDSSGDRRYFKLDLVCATNLPIAAPGQYVRFGRDVAVLKISPVPKGQGWY